MHCRHWADIRRFGTLPMQNVLGQALGKKFMAMIGQRRHLVVPRIGAIAAAGIPQDWLLIDR
jgi:hypothetical protein